MRRSAWSVMAMVITGTPLAEPTSVSVPAPVQVTVAPLEVSAGSAPSPSVIS